MDSDYLKSTRLINARHPQIQKKSQEIAGALATEEEKAEALFLFVRDGIRYQFKAQRREEDYFASAILQAGRGFCTQKAILLCALARAAGIPAGVRFFDIVDHALPKPMKILLRGNTLFFHGVAELWLNRTWITLDATLDRFLAQRNGLDVVAFQSGQHCLMPSVTRDGKPHIEYVKDRGRFSDLSFNTIAAWMREGYPHLFEKVDG